MTSKGFMIYLFWLMYIYGVFWFYSVVVAALLSWL
jgi:hypothetical protein